MKRSPLTKSKRISKSRVIGKKSVPGHSTLAGSRVLVVSSERPLTDWSTDETVRVRLAATFEQAAPPNSCAKRLSPIHPLADDTIIPDLENGTWLAHFLVVADPFRALGRISRQTYPNVRRPTCVIAGLRLSRPYRQVMPIESLPNQRLDDCLAAHVQIASCPVRFLRHVPRDVHIHALNRLHHPALALEGTGTFFLCSAGRAITPAENAGIHPVPHRTGGRKSSRNIVGNEPGESNCRGRNLFRLLRSDLHRTSGDSHDQPTEQVLFPHHATQVAGSVASDALRHAPHAGGHG